MAESAAFLMLLAVLMWNSLPIALDAPRVILFSLLPAKFECAGARHGDFQVLADGEAFIVSGPVR